MDCDQKSIILTLFSRWAISKVRRRPFRPQTRHLRGLKTLDREDARLSSLTCPGLVKCSVSYFLQRFDVISFIGIHVL